MPEDQIPQPKNDDQNEASLGGLPNASEAFGTLRNGSESFRNVRNDSESFRNLPNLSERNENHTLTVREVARMFEAAGVARTERSIVNWCQRNAQGIARLDAYFDPNERRYFITPQSVEQAIAEEKAKAAKGGHSETAGNIRGDSERQSATGARVSESNSRPVEDLKMQIRDLEITNRVKDKYIEQLKSEKEQFQVEREGYVKQLIQFSRKVGELETKLLPLEESGQRDVLKQIKSRSADIGTDLERRK